jgi:hypothetical protein
MPVVERLRVTVDLDLRILKKILTIDSVELISIGPAKPLEPVQTQAVVRAPKALKKAKASNEKFKHPTGKPAQTFLLEFFTQNPNPISRAQLNQHLVAQGFRSSSTSSALRKLISDRLARHSPNGIGYELDNSKGIE